MYVLTSDSLALQGNLIFFFSFKVLTKRCQKFEKKCCTLQTYIKIFYICAQYL